MAAFSATVLNALPVWRNKVGKQGLTDLKTRLLEDRCAYILFPEGTRSRNGEMKSFKAGLGMLVAGTDVPVVPCRLTGTHAAFPPGYWLPRLSRIGVRFGEPMTFADVVNRRSGWENIAERTEAAVRALVPPRRGR
jgi:1-acyl-sn-glycerol-3-phosphate acyltransferase